MPLFKYRCNECHQQFEELVSFSESQNVECPNCQSKNTDKLVSTFATIGGSSGKSSSASCGGGSGHFT
ncbi:MAG: zinc ribbon domain-containing protein [Calditrichota bacterium]|jgi:putative FmdB family regulatory protein